jgi:hypothetical protein
MFIVDVPWTVFHTEFLGMIKNCLCTTYHVRGSDSSSDIDIKSRANSWSCHYVDVFSKMNAWQICIFSMLHIGISFQDPKLCNANVAPISEFRTTAMLLSANVGF